jgi:ascorbate PTS system EIIB component
MFQAKEMEIMIKIACVCGAGVGSSLLVKMAIEKILKKNGFPMNNLQIECADLQSGRGLAMFSDIVVSTYAFKDSLMDVKCEKVLVHNIFKNDELEEKLVPVYREVYNRKK